MTGSPSVQELSPTQFLSERAFTHPDHIFYDKRLLSYMARRVCGLFETGQVTANHPHMTTLGLMEADGRSHRVIVSRPRELMMSGSLAVVGFFGQRRVAGTEHLPMDTTDQMLVQTMRDHDGLYCYSSQELTCGNFVNLVLFRDIEAVQFWGRCPVHARYAQEISPQYYYTIRIYNGALPDGLSVPGKLMLGSVKYYDYQSVPTWRGSRPLLANAR